jgi:hypothetical protein
VVGTEGSTLGSGEAGVVGANLTRMRRPIGAKPGGTGGVGNGASVSWKAIVTLEKMLAMWWRAASWLSLRGRICKRWV